MLELRRAAIGGMAIGLAGAAMAGLHLMDSRSGTIAAVGCATVLCVDVIVRVLAPSSGLLAAQMATLSAQVAALRARVDVLDLRLDEVEVKTISALASANAAHRRASSADLAADRSGGVPAIDVGPATRR